MVGGEHILIKVFIFNLNVHLHVNLRTDSLCDLQGKIRSGDVTIEPDRYVMVGDNPDRHTYAILQLQSCL